jgi:predicted histone-like DNA-binding protein
MSKILYEVYKNDIKDSESAMFGKYYARLKSIETMNISKMAKHISEHGSVFTEDVVEGVMKKFKSCLIEMLLESKKVKVNGLGTFYLTCECQKGGADKEEDFNVKENLKALHIRFLPDQTAEENLSSREFIKKAEFYNIKNLLNTGSGDAITPDDGDDSGDTDGKTDGNENENQNQNDSNENENENQNPGGGNGGGGTGDGTDES